jgi:hypothetical protein
LYSISDRPSPKASSSITSVSTSESENVPLTNKARVKRKKAPKQEVEQSLYSYFSSPVASPRSSQPDASIVLDRREQTLPTGKLLFNNYRIVCLDIYVRYILELIRGHTS